MDRYWLLSWTTYGTWLPGDARGSVTSVRQGSGARSEHDVVGTPYDSAMPGLRDAAQGGMNGPPVFLETEQAEILLVQFQETANRRGWELRAVAIMANHVHIVVGVPGDPKPEYLVRDFKSYGSGALNRRWQKPASETWWTTGGGSRRKLSSEVAIAAAIEYGHQEFPLVIWVRDGEAGGRT